VLNRLTSCQQRTAFLLFKSKFLKTEWWQYHEATDAKSGGSYGGTERRDYSDDVLDGEEQQNKQKRCLISDPVLVKAMIVRSAAIISDHGIV